MTSRCLAACVAVSALIAALPAHSASSPTGFRFEDVTETHLPDAPGRNTMDVVAIDLDGDGRPDIVTAQEFLLNKILMNEDGGRFRDASHLLEPLSAEELEAGPPQLRGPGFGHDSEDVSVADFDGDGLLDLIIVSEDDVKFGREVHEYYRGTPDGFKRVRGVLPDTEANAVAHADVNGDGCLDVLIAGAGQDRLLIGDCRGGFVDESSARLPRESATAQDAEFADLNGDGHLDLVLGLEGGHALWINDGTGVFRDETAERLPDPGNVEARKVAAVDIDGDGHLDLYFSHVAWQGRQGQDRLLINDGAGRFRDETAERIPAEIQTTLDARFADLNGDGHLDMVRANFGPVTIWLNDGQGRFRDVTGEVLGDAITGPNLAISLTDFDGDGRVDLYVGQLKGPQGGPEIRDRLLLNRPTA